MIQNIRSSHTIRNHTIKCNGKVITALHDEVHLKPKLLDEQLYGGWEITKGSVVGSRTRTMVGISSPTSARHIMQVTTKPKLLFSTKLTVGGLDASTFDIFADMSLKGT